MVERSPLRDGDGDRLRGGVFRDELLATVGPLFAPGAPRLSRFARSGGGRTCWMVVPSLRHPIVLVPPGNEAAAVAFRPPRPGRGGRRMRTLAFLQRKGLMRYLPLHRLVLESDEVTSLLRLLQAVVEDVDDIVLRLGRRRHNRALVLLALGANGEVCSFIKIARSGSGKNALEWEYQNLLQMLERPVPGLQAPRPQGYWRSRDLDFLALEPLITQELHVSRPVPVTQMRALAEKQSSATRPIVDAELVQRLRGKAAELRDPDRRTWALGALDRTLEDWGQVPVPLGPWHGDWVPWNMARRGETVLLWDWEHFEAEVPCGFDHVHYLAQDIRLGGGVDAPAEDRWVREAATALSNDWGLDRSQQQVVLRLYLIVVNVRYLLDRQDDPAGIPPRRGWSHELLERLDLDAPRADVGRLEA